MVGKEKLESIFNKYGCKDFRWIDPRAIVTARWVRNKCKFGCHNYGRRACCPPNTPPVSECRQFFDEYTTGAIFHFPGVFEQPEERHEWGRVINEGLMSMERDIFLSGYQKTFLLPMAPCRVCEECTGAKEDCKNPQLARPTPEGMAIDVYSTVRNYGFPIEVVTDYAQAINKYAFLLVE